MPIQKVVTGQKINPEKLRKAKDLRQKMTEAESVLWQSLKANRFLGYHFRRQQIIRGFIVDFYCHALSFVIEVDGPVHEHQKKEDAERDQSLAEIGLRVLRFKNAEVLTELYRVLDEISKNLTPHPPFPEGKGGEGG
jgi:very-short-patch-repair endonuclease